MAIAYAHAVRHLGRPVWVLTKDRRRYYGVVHRVTPTHLYLRPIHTPPSGVSPYGYVRPMHDGQGTPDVEPLGAASTHLNVEPTQWWWGWRPIGFGLIALPLFTLLALGLLWI
ncbi:MAG: hypothetical protein IMW86_02860 [Hydrogenibacillus sp.]|nr:hypothetical protein [Hydrogenibacillus sp.]